jgi:nicotinamidase-related amidase
VNGSHVVAGSIEESANHVPHMSNSSTQKHGVALLLIDVINPLNFPGSARLVKAATRAAPNIERLAARARRAKIPVLYANDNFGQWRSDFKATIEACTNAEQPGSEIAERLRPHGDDYFVLKPQHSAFYSTTWEPLLEHIGAHTLVLAGFATDLCIAFTANDAHMRGYRVAAPADCTAANTPALKRAALTHVRVALGGDIRASSALDLIAMRRGQKKPRGQTF